MANHEIFYAVCDLFNEGATEVSLDKAEQVRTAAQHTLPGFAVCSGAVDTDKNTIVLYVDNYKDAK